MHGPRQLVHGPRQLVHSPRQLVHGPRAQGEEVGGPGLPPSTTSIISHWAGGPPGVRWETLIKYSMCLVVSGTCCHPRDVTPNALYENPLKSGGQLALEISFDTSKFSIFTYICRIQYI